MTTEHVYLVPGFFGFVNFGRLVYFGHVREFLEAALGGRGVAVEIHRVRVSPTASLRQRAAELANHVAETAPTGPIHIIGHSTGGLDARLFATPGVSLGDGMPEIEDLARRIKTVVAVTAPHRGTPLASFFTGLLGQQLLGVLSLATVAVLREGRLPLSLVAKLGGVLSRAALPGSTAEALVSALEHELLERLPDDERGVISEFFAQIGRDQALLPQLTPAGIDLFAATCSPRPGVRYGSVVARARPPHLTGHLRVRGLDGQATYLLYRFLHRQAGASRGDAPAIDDDQRRALLAGLGSLPRSEDSDGVVPTWSQVFGEVIAAVEGDHLDVIGHFRDDHRQPPHHDWLATGSRFDRAGFEQLWRQVATFIVPEPPRRWWQVR
jgi:triacylglycerol lipase